MQVSFTFQKRDYSFFLLGLILLITGFLCMAFDPVENGFGFLTLWMAPILLLVGFCIPIMGIVGVEAIRKSLYGTFSSTRIRQNRVTIMGGVMVFGIALITYLLTMEPTASLWDCSEFIAAAYKLQVPHTPGNPLFIIMGRLFTMFSFGDVNKVAVTMNVMSALFSALAVLTLYHMILLFVKRIVGKTDFPSLVKMLAAMVGALSMAFIDSFWFSAVEAETYAAASFFLLFNGWLGLMVLRIKEPETENRWKILTSYCVGLSYGIHPMSLLAIPFIALLWYFKNREITVRRVGVAVLLGFSVLLVINRLVAVGIFEMAFQFDLLAVNGLGLPFYSGVAVFIILLASFAYLLVTRKQNWNTATWSVVFLILGFSSYLVLFIRSNHNPPIDETNPENMAMIKAYMNRESYGSRPLVYGPYYDAEITEVEQGNKVYFKSKDQYEVAGHWSQYSYDGKRQTILPRIYSRDEGHIQQYRAWAGIGEHEKPTFIHNLKFMVQYQLGHMYWRYLMWNFGGRVSDIQHDGWLRPWSSVTTEIKNKARNQYWMLPFMLGIIGFIYQYKVDKKAFFASVLFFLTTGIILNLYLNSPPNEPRERDYIYVGSFMLYCIWIGYGSLSIWNFLQNFNRQVAIITVAIVSLGIPILLLSMNWDDHDRSQRTIHMDSARNLLNTCEPNAILFTGGDNDTFPLWYLQEVEGFRTDVRVIVLSYFNTDWYINQLRKKYYDSDAFQLTLSQKDYVQFGRNDVLYYRENPKIQGAIHAGKFINLLKEEHPSLNLMTSSGEIVHQIPSRNLYIPIQKDEIIAKTNIPSELKGNLQEKMVLKLKEHYLEKNALVLLDLILSNHWERPMYFNYTSINAIGLDVKPYLVQEGQLFQLLPVLDSNNTPQMNRDKMYLHLITTLDFDNLYNKDIYLNHEDFLSRIVIPMQQYYTTLSAAFFNNGDKVKAKKVMDKYVALFNQDHLPGTYADLQAVQLLNALGEDDKAHKISEKAAQYFNIVSKYREYDENNDPFNEYLARQFSAFSKNLQLNENATIP